MILKLLDSSQDESQYIRSINKRSYQKLSELYFRNIFDLKKLFKEIGKEEVEKVLAEM